MAGRLKPLDVERQNKHGKYADGVVEAQANRESGEDASATTSRSALAVPATLQASLMARLDRLGLGPKKMAQIGAAIGREFSYELVAAVAGPSEGEIQDRLARLVHSELVFQRGAPPEAVYSFKHALVQDAAYNTLLRSDRRRLHARIAEAVEGRFPDRVAREPELLAHHFTAACQIERAVGYWLSRGNNPRTGRQVARAPRRPQLGAPVV